MVCSHCHEAIAETTYEGQPICHSCQEGVLYSMARRVMLYRPSFEDMDREGLLGTA